MLLETVDFSDMLTIGTVIFTAGALTWQLRSNSHKLDQLVEKDKEHDLKLHDHDKRIAVVETHVENQGSTINKMYARMEELYKHLMGKK